MTQILSPNKYTGRIKPIRLIVVHTMEVDEADANVAEAVGNDFARPVRKASAHVGVDTDSSCRYVPDGDTAWAAPGANADGLQLEMAGRAGQTSGDWTDDASRAILERGAQQVAEWCKAYGIPVRHLSDAELAAGASGIIGHDAASRVYKGSSHWDPGPDFPWDSFIARVQELVGGAQPVSNPIPAPTPEPAAPAEVQVGWTIRKGDRGPGVVEVEQILAALGFYGGDIDGIAGDQFDAATCAFQRAAGITDDGAFGPVSRLMARNIPAFPGTTVQGSKGAATHAFQQRLKDRGWKIAVDDDHGPATSTVLRAFQAEKGLSVDGAGGPQTWTALYTRSL